MTNPSKALQGFCPECQTTRHLIKKGQLNVLVLHRRFGYRCDGSNTLPLLGTVQEAEDLDSRLKPR